MTAYKGIIFDLDNTLMNYSACELDAMRRTCRDHGLFIDDEQGWERFWQAYGEINTRHWINHVTGGDVKTIGDVLRFSFRDTLQAEEQLHEKLSDTYWRYFCSIVYFEDGAEELLDYIRDKYKTAIITNGLAEAQYQRLDAGKIRGLFHSVVVSDEAGVRKPDKAIFELALSQLGLGPEEVLFVGDSIADDYYGAVNAGIDFCYYNPRGAELPPDVKPAYVIGHLSEIVEVAGL